MITGFPPFHDKSNMNIYNNIINAEIEYPRRISSQAQDLIRKLLVRDPSQRLGHVNGAQDLKNHKWFQTVNFDNIFSQTSPCPTM
mmetsp:Transcript_34023/g.47137  ORF Transcript_34023/g.47137 Transcript_34023/m.47137 type:complete len:85 (+) Transcript_34023:39-293(+)